MNLLCTRMNEPPEATIKPITEWIRREFFLQFVKAPFFNFINHPLKYKNTIVQKHWASKVKYFDVDIITVGLFRAH